MSGYSVWFPYAGSGAVILAAVLLIIAGIFAFLGVRLHDAIGVEKPGRAVSLPAALNVASKILSFVTAITLFVPLKVSLA